MQEEITKNYKGSTTIENTNIREIRYLEVSRVHSSEWKWRISFLDNDIVLTYVKA